MTAPAELCPLAQSMSSVIPPPYAELHPALLFVFTTASINNRGWPPPELRVPHPVMKQSTLGASTSPTSGKQTGAMQSVQVTGVSSSRMAKSNPDDALL